MKRYESDSWNTLALDGGYRLAVYGETIAEVKEEIDRANERAVERGYKPEQWIITHIEVYKYVDDNGVFLKREEIEERVTIYPESI